MKKINNNQYLKLYCIYDKVAEEYLFQYACYCKSDGQYVRSVLKLAMQTYPLPDIVPCELLSVDGKNARMFDWTCYKAVETVADNLAPLGITPEQAKEMIKRKASEEDLGKEEKVNE